MTAPDEQKHLITNQAYLDQLVTVLLCRMHHGTVDQYIGYLAMFYRQASIIKLSFQLLSSRS